MLRVWASTTITTTIYYCFHSLQNNFTQHSLRSIKYHWMVLLIFMKLMPCHVAVMTCTVLTPLTCSRSVDAEGLHSYEHFSSTNLVVMVK